MSIEVIRGSEKWTKVVPDEYAIKCIEQYPAVDDKRDRILKFLFLAPVCRVPGSGFTQMCGIAKVPMNTEGIVIIQDDLWMMPEIYFRQNEKLIYGGTLKKCEICWAVYAAPKFSKISHYSEMNVGKQKSDESAPEWLKEFVKKHSGNAAYFEFQIYVWINIKEKIIAVVYNLIVRGQNSKNYEKY